MDMGQEKDSRKEGEAGLVAKAERVGLPEGQEEPHKNLVFRGQKV